MKFALSALGGLAIIYGVATLAFVASSPDIRLHCLLWDQGNETPLGGVTIRDTSGLVDCKGVFPEVGDELIELGKHRTSTFLDLSQAIAELRGERPDPGGQLYAGADPLEELSDSSSLSLVEEEGGRRFVRIRFRPAGQSDIVRSFVPLHSQPPGGVALTLIWFVLQLGVFVVSAVAYWSRPFDRPSRLFFASCVFTIFAFAGGNHWWVIGGSLWFSLPFVISAILLPAVLLHFFLHIPRPRPLVERWPWLSLVAIYTVPAFVAVSASAVVIVVHLISLEATDQGLFAAVVGSMGREQAARLLALLGQGVYLYLIVATLYFGLSLLALVSGQRHARNAFELQQLKWILRAAILSIVPILYTVYLAYSDRSAFALGAARFPMFLTSLSFMLAYAIGIARYKLMLVDEVVSRGMMYYFVSYGSTLLYSLIIAVGSVALLHQDLTVFGQATSITIVLMLTVIVLGWLRDRIQRVIDRRFYREKYRLDNTLRQMNQAVGTLVEPETLVERMLASCCEVLNVTHAALYVREHDTDRYILQGALGISGRPSNFTAPPELEESLSQGDSIQRVRSGNSPVQNLIRSLNAQLMHGLDLDGRISGVLLLGGKSNGAPFTAEDVAFLNAVGQITGIALHCTRVHVDVTRLNHDLQAKIEKIDVQTRQISMLQNELTQQQQPVTAGVETGTFRRGEMQGSSPAMQEVLATVQKVASSESSVLVRGESGTGKELLAKAIHENSPRAGGPLVSLHCAALSPTLLESELFGHVKGAFTDARDDKIGRFEQADGGTLFLDEIGDISLEVQIKLLRVLQERSIERVGGSKSIDVDVRLVAATHQNLEQLIADGRFREDLYYRLNVISITLPPLRERKEDVLELAVSFLRRAAARAGKSIGHIDQAALNLLIDYEWPGNIRQLQNVIERAVVLADGDRITPGDLPAELTTRRRTSSRVYDAKPSASPARLASYPPVPSAADIQPDEFRRLSAPSQVGDDHDDDDQAEKQQLLAALEKCDGNKAQAARLLDMPRSTYYSKLKKHSLL